MSPERRLAIPRVWVLLVALVLLLAEIGRAHV